MSPDIDPPTRKTGSYPKSYPKNGFECESVGFSRSAFDAGRKKTRLQSELGFWDGF